MVNLVWFGTKKKQKKNSLQLKVIADDDDDAVRPIKYANEIVASPDDSIKTINGAAFVAIGEQ